MATATLAAWATSLKSSALPSHVRHAALRSWFNFVGCAIYGRSHQAVGKATEALRPFFGPPRASLLGTRGLGKVDALHAALLNGIASHVHDYDDTHLETIIHPTGPVASALLAYAEHHGDISGKDFLLALTVGIEAECKVGLAVWPTHYDIGWHISSTVGSIGATLAVGKLMGLSQEAMEHAIGLAAVQVTGLRKMFGSDTKSFHPGRAAQAGLMAALLAEKGYTSSPQALEAKRGWANVVIGGGTPQLDKYVGELGQIWEIEKNAFKPFPCGIVCHPVIDACIRIHREMQAHGQEPSELLKSLKFTTRVHPLVIELTSKQAPRDGLEGKFSVSHGAAVGLLYGKAGPAQYADSVVRDPKVIAVRESVTTLADREIRSDEAVVTGNFLEASTPPLHVHVDHALGSIHVPMTDEQLTEKFVDQVSLVYRIEEVGIASEVSWKFGDAGDICKIAQKL